MDPLQWHFGQLLLAQHAGESASHPFSLQLHRLPLFSLHVSSHVGVGEEAGTVTVTEGTVMVVMTEGVMTLTGGGWDMDVL